jgi:NADH-quinone oxidoreductase subunit L
MVIHSLHKAQPSNIHFDVQDIRNMGGLKKVMPTAFFTFLLSGASLAGVPFFSGFLSKEAILTAIFMHTHFLSWLMLVVIISVSFITVLYTFRMIWFVFMDEPRVLRAVSIAEPGWLMKIPVMILAGCSLWLLVSWNPFDFNGWMLAGAEGSLHGIWITLFSILWVLAALTLSWYSFRKGRFRTNELFHNSFYVDRFYASLSTKAIGATTRGVSHVDQRWINRAIHAFVYLQVIIAHVTGWIDRIFIDGTVNATARFAGFGGKITRSFQGGNIQLYIFWSVFAIIIFIIWAIK